MTFWNLLAKNVLEKRTQTEKDSQILFASVSLNFEKKKQNFNLLRIAISVQSHIEKVNPQTAKAAPVLGAF